VSRSLVGWKNFRATHGWRTDGNTSLQDPQGDDELGPRAAL
jgi:hypothetical protein